MELTNGEKTSDLRECQAQVLVWNQILSYINSMSLKCAVELGIPDVIHNHGRPMTLPDLVSALGIPQARAGFLHRLMRMLSHSGFFALQTEQPCVNRDKGEEKPEGYVLTPPSQLLLKGDRSSKSMHPLVAFVVHPILIQPFNGLSKWFHSDSSGTPFEMQHGRAFWEYIARDPDFNLLTNEGMASDSSVVVSEIMDKCRRSFEQSTSVVDVGGGTGLLARKIADTFPHLEVTVLDLPHVVCGLEGTKTLKFLAGDMFDSIPPADIILLKGKLSPH
ncbi:trans-resveratrol di-O-methyltransferase-like isoform X2 [Punica granatum]|uniref:Trans-resveratrol di-O-methyltransferase-like isoform X2 n=1 Tax=Punica granatum TaxID=22663 RepID=A0A6P8D8P0_PUNGR|nr:trans-resveratrol di-O-methyltransferase-like isoform X2 [Punica granatum]